MKTVLVRYSTRADRADENQALIHGVFEELRDRAPAGLRYDAFRLADSTSFVHVAMIDTADGSNPLVTLDAFKRFLENLDERCTEVPVAMQLIRLDGYQSVEQHRVA